MDAVEGHHVKLRKPGSGNSCFFSYVEARLKRQAYTQK
jgi:hypothetical protein